MTDRASRALEVVERDPEARARFAAAYGRPGDPVARLRREVWPDATADAARDAEVARLRRVAFDRTNTAAEEHAAELARRELAAREEEALASRAALARGIDAALEPAAHPPSSGPEGTAPTGDEEPRRSRRPAWLVPAAGALVVGIAATSAVWAWAGGAAVPAPPGASRSPSPIEYFLGDPPDGVVEPGDVEAAEVWFDREQTADDLVGVGELRPEFDRASVRLVHSSPIARVWVAKQVDGRFCLETTDTFSQVTNGTCAVAGDFEQSGLSVASNVLTADWNGPQVRVVLSQR